MSDEEYDDELPPISVNSSARDSQGLLHMPSAEELASQRAREAECERELQLLRTADNDPVLATTDSSGSEGEAALAAAVTALRVRALSRARPPALGALLPALLAALPCAALRERLQRGDDAAQVEAQEALVEHMCAIALLEDPPGAAEEAALAGAVLCAGALAARGRAARRAARRALHVLLEHASFAQEDSEVSVAFRAAVLAGVAGSQRVELADALAPVLPTSRTAELLHRQLLVATLAELLDVDAAEAQEASSACACAWASRAVSGRWGALDAARGGPCVRAAGRVVRACPGGPGAKGPGAKGPGAGGPACAAARARLLAALAAQPASARTAPDRLEVLVGASKLQLLFRD